MLKGLEQRGTKMRIHHLMMGRVISYLDVISYFYFRSPILHFSFNPSAYKNGHKASAADSAWLVSAPFQFHKGALAAENRIPWSPAFRYKTNGE